MANVLMVVAPKDFRDEEYFEPREILENAGHKITVASTKLGELLGIKDGEAWADIIIDSVHTQDYDCIIFVGGLGSAIYQDNPTINKLIDQFLKQGSIVSAICLAPMILAKGGYLNNIKATVNIGYVDEFKNCGVKYLNEGVVSDGQFITADGPTSANLFGQTLRSSLIHY
jgi:protease I